MSFNSLFGLGGSSEDANLEGFWPLQDDAASTTVDDASTNAGDGTATFDTSDQSATGPNSWLTKALDLGIGGFNVTRYIDLPTVVTGKACSVALWVEVDLTIGDQCAISLSDASLGNAQDSITVDQNASDKIQVFFRNGGGQFVSPGSTATTGWNFVCMVLDSESSRSLYIGSDAAVTSTVTTSAITYSNIDIGRLGDSTPSAYFQKGIAGVSIFSDALTSAEVEQIRLGPEPVNTAAPVLSGTETEGSTLSCTSGTWGLPSPFSSGSNGAISNTYQWTRSNDAGGTGEADIDGATAATYTLQAADVGKFISCRVRAGNDAEGKVAAGANFDSTQDTPSNMSGAISASGGTPPTIQSAVTDTLGSQIILTFDQVMTEADATGWSATVDGLSATLGYVSGSGSNTLTFSASIFGNNFGPGEAVLISYDATAGNAEGTGGLLASFTDYPATNNVPFNVTITESFSLSDTVTASAVASASLAESAALADTLSATAVASALVAESLTLADTLTATAVTTATITESLTINDAYSDGATVTVTVTISENLIVSDSLNATAVSEVSITEALGLSDTVASTANAQAVTTESMGISSTLSVNVAANATVTESLLLADSYAAAAVASATVTESLSVSDSILVGQILDVTITESLTINDAWSVTVFDLENVSPAAAWWYVLVSGTLTAPSIAAPNALGEMSQWSLDFESDYTTVLSDSVPRLTELLPLNQTAAPRGVRCVQLDGIDDHLKSAEVAGENISYPFTITCKFRTSLHHGAWLFNLAKSNQYAFRVISEDDGTLYIRRAIESPLTTSETTIPFGGYDDDAWHTFTIEFTDATTFRYWIDDAETPTTLSGLEPISGPDPVKWVTISEFFQGRMADCRLYPEAFTTEKHTKVRKGQILDEVPLLAYWLNEESGSKHYNAGSLGAAFDLTVLDATLSEYHVADEKLGYNIANDLGFTLNAGVVVPRNEANPTHDAQGNPLGVTGPVAISMSTLSPCFTGNGTDVALVVMQTIVNPVRVEFSLKRNLAEINTTDIVMLQGEPGSLPLVGLRGDALGRINTVVRTVNNLLYVTNTIQNAAPVGQWMRVRLEIDYSVGGGFRLYIDDVLRNDTPALDFSQGLTTTRIAVNSSPHTGIATDDCLVSDLRITDEAGMVYYMPLQEGAGRDVALLRSDGTSNWHAGAITGGSEDDIWAEKSPLGQSWSMLHGGAESAGAFVAGNVGAANAANGAAKTLDQRELQSGDRVNGDPYSALTGLGIPANWPQLACLTGDGATRYVSVGTRVNPSVLDFWMKANADLTDEICGIRAGTPIVTVNRASVNRISVTVRDATSGFAFGTSPVESVLLGVWYHIRVEIDWANGTGGWRLFIDGVLRTTVGGRDLGDGVTGDFGLISSGAGAWKGPHSLANFTLTDANGTSFFPLCEGQGDVIHEWVEGSSSPVYRSLIGTLPGAWDTITDGSVPADYRQLPSIPPFGTKFCRRDGHRRLTYRDAIQPANLTTALEYTNG